jgi:hypothetical protein
LLLGVDLLFDMATMITNCVIRSTTPIRYDISADNAPKITQVSDLRDIVVKHKFIDTTKET